MKVNPECRLEQGETLDPFTNLNLDSRLLTSDALFVSRLWVNNRCVVLGRHLTASEEVDLDYARQSGIPMVWRISGGGAVFHDPGVLNYSISCRADLAGFCVEESLRRLSTPVTMVLDELGLPWAWEAPNNIYIRGRKVSGSAQARKRGRVLHHGSILVAADLTHLRGVLKPGGRSNHAPVTNLAEFFPGATVEMVKLKLGSALSSYARTLTRMPST